MVKTQRKDLSRLLEHIDAFGEDLPTFNIRGNDKITSTAGGVVTILIAFVVFAFTLVKFTHFMERHNPNMSSYSKQIEIGDSLNFGQANTRIAFAIEDYYDPIELKDDDRYVRWVVRMFGKKDDVTYHELLPFHRCTEEDF